MAAGAATSAATGPINAFTVDVEDYFQVSAFERQFPRDEKNHRRQTHCKRNHLDGKRPPSKPVRVRQATNALFVESLCRNAG